MPVKSYLPGISAIALGNVAMAFGFITWLSVRTPNDHGLPDDQVGTTRIATVLPDEDREPAFGLPEVWEAVEAHKERPKDPPAPRHVLESRGRRPATIASFGPFTAVQVNVDDNGDDIIGDAANEPSIAVDPSDPDRIVIGWRQFDSITSGFRNAGYAYSHDTGETWTTGVLDAKRFGTDPVVAADGFGNFYYSSLTCLDFPSCGDIRVHVFKSSDGGITWPVMTDSFGGDKQWFAVDRRTMGQGSGHIYQYWTAKLSCCPPANFTRSVDGGLTFEAPGALPSPGAKWGTLDVAPDGTLYLVGATPSVVTHSFMRSKLASNPFFSPFIDLAQEVSLGGYSVGLPGADSPNPTGLLGHVWIAAHPTDSNKIYILGSVRPPDGDPLDVHFIRSDDGGETWSDPVAVNDNPGDGTWQWFGMISVAPNGRIDVAWNDTRSNPDVSNLSQLYYAYSEDDGASWSEGIALTSVFNSHIGFPLEGKIGDYNQMVSEDGAVHIAFAATFNGGQDVYYLRLTPPSNPPAPLAEPVPVAKNRFISFVVPENDEPRNTAIRVRLTSLHHPKEPPDAPDFSSFEGQYRFVRLFRDNNEDPVFNCLDSAPLVELYYCATLGCEPEYRDWSADFGGEVLHVTSRAIVPSSYYEVANLDVTCIGAEYNCPVVSPELGVVTSVWGNVIPGVLNVLDIAAIVEKVSGRPNAPHEVQTLLVPSQIEAPTAQTTVLHIAAAADALRGFAYPYAGPTECP